MTEEEKKNLYAKTFEKFFAGDYDKAIKILSQIIAKYPDEADAYVNRGVTYNELGKYDEAIKDYNEAININPDYTEAYFNRGLAYKKLGKYDEAIKDYNQALKINPEYAVAYVNRGNAYHKLGKYEKAIKDYNQALKINPKYAAAYYNRGTAYGKLGKYEDAIKDYNQALKINPEYAKAYNNRGHDNYKLGKYEDAIKDYNQALKINPDYAGAYLNRGNAYDELEEYEKAINDFNQALKINPDYAGAYHNRGLAYGSIGDKNEAFEDFAKSFANDKKEKSKNFLDRIFYRFVNYNKDVLQAILNDKFYLSKLDNFNDPFDGIIKERLELFYKEFLERFYITSMCKKNDEILMWSHYANSHKGICLAYQFTVDFFIKYNAYIDKIEYKDQIYYDPKNVFWKSVFFHKYKNLSYEEEYRLIMLNKDTNQPNLINCENFIELKGIYLGYKCPDQDKETLIKLAHEKSIKIYETSLEDKNLYKLIFSEIN